MFNVTVWHLISTLQPTSDESQGGECSSLNPPFYVNYCRYDGAASVLNKVPLSHLTPTDHETFRRSRVLNMLPPHLQREETSN